MFKIIIILLLVFLFLFLLLNLIPTFSRKPSKKDKMDYFKRASNYKKSKFHNDSSFSVVSRAKEKNKFISSKNAKPKDKIPVKMPDVKNKLNKNDLTITLLGHSTSIIRMGDVNILIDPIFSMYASPIPFIGPKRFSDIPIKINELSHIDIVIITHDHYDHLDYNTIKKIDYKVDKYIVPLGIENHLKRWKVSNEKIINLSWWEEVKVKNITIGCTPARHFSGRSIDDSYNTLWTSWILKNDYYKIFESGDTGYGNHFKEIKEKYGDFDVAMLDSGQYDKKWPMVHMNPKESVAASKELNAKYVIPIHYGAFKLANHPWDEPLESFVLNAEKENVNYLTPMLGETIDLSNAGKYKEKWWRNIK